jgi:hypothetical protein
MFNIVYSSSICLSEAIDTANRLKADMKSIRTHDLSDAFSSLCDEDLILHKAVGILRKHIGDLVIESSEYTSPTRGHFTLLFQLKPCISVTFLVELCGLC